MTVHHAIVRGDPLSSGGDGRVMDGSPYSTIEGPDGLMRAQAYLGHRVWCDACKSVGIIAAGAKISQSLRGYDEQLRAFEAVNDDRVFCKCSPSPRLIARYARTVLYQDHIPSSRDTSAAPAVRLRETYDEQFVLCGANGTPIPNTYYTVRFPSGALEYGTTDAQGRTARYATDRADSIHVYIGHREEI